MTEVTGGDKEDASTSTAEPGTALQGQGRRSRALSALRNLRSNVKRYVSVCNLIKAFTGYSREYSALELLFSQTSLGLYVLVWK